MNLSTELRSLHHVDEAGLELKLKVLSFKCWTSADILDAWSREFAQSLVSHGFRNWCNFFLIDLN